jgi:gamma-glutamylcyclotransferase (GGCT)/AIG2-like uncharacterized protein YtfP
MMYLAYGSNLCLNRLRRRVPSAEFVGRARVDGYRLRFHKRGYRDGSGKANVQHTGGAEDRVWGALFRCSAGEKRQLDRVEGLGSGYNERMLEVRLEDGRLDTARAYVADAAAIDDALVPFRWYLRYVQAGARERGLPFAYQHWLMGQRFLWDPDPERARRNVVAPACAAG